MNAHNDQPSDFIVKAFGEIPEGLALRDRAFWLVGVAALRGWTAVDCGNHIKLELETDDGSQHEIKLYVVDRLEVEVQPVRRN